MNSIVQIDEKDWEEIAASVYIAVLPFSADELEQKYGLKAFEYEDDGLGRVKTCIIQIENTKYWLSSYLDGPDIARFVVVEVQSFEPDTRVALTQLLDALDIHEKSLVHCQDDLGPAKWILYRVDDNGNETEMYRFHQQESAVWVGKKYEKKGHKQLYLVTKAT